MRQPFVIVLSYLFLRDFSFSVSDRGDSVIRKKKLKKLKSMKNVGTSCAIESTN